MSIVWCCHMLVSTPLLNALAVAEFLVVTCWLSTERWSPELQGQQEGVIEETTLEIPSKQP